MAKLKKKSKRMPCKLKYKIIKKVAEHNRKLQRNSKTSNKKPKDIGVPNSVPFKDEILREAEKLKIQAKQLKEARRESKLKRKMPNQTVEQVLSDADLSVLEVSLNPVKVEDLLTSALEIIEKIDPTQLRLHYTVPEFSSSYDLLSMLAKRMGKYKQGGVPNCEEAAKRLLKDWTVGKITARTFSIET